MDALYEAETNSNELFEHYSYKVDAGQSPLRIDKFLMNFVVNATRNKIQNAAKKGYVFVNEIPVKPNYKVKGGDQIKVLFPHPPHEQLLIGEAIPLDIIYEDEHLLVVNKPAGMVVHPGHGNYRGTLVNALIHHFDDLPLNSNQRPGLVHRIDKDTSGLLVVAKTEDSMSYLTHQFAEKTSQRQYIALVWGRIENDQGTIVGNIGRHPKDRMQNTVYLGEEKEKGKPAITHYKVLERMGYVTLVSCTLETGRTHQIRVHMKHIGHTLFNDARYGGDVILKGTTFTKYKQFVSNCFKVLPRQALHAQTLGFKHPHTKKWMSFEVALPDDIQNCIIKWRNYTKHQFGELGRHLKL